MLRRDAIGLLLGACASGRAGNRDSLDPFLGVPDAAAVLIDVPSGRLIAAGGSALASRALRPPGSAVKPFVLASLLESGALKAEETFRCPGRLRLLGRSFDCIHPVLAQPFTAGLALAYSCNCFVAHAAERFRPGDLAVELERFGLAAPTGLFSGESTGHIRIVTSADAQRVQALGEDAIEITAAELALGYRSLALRIQRPDLRPILTGLEGAVEFGTAQNASVEGVRVAGKTGSALTSAGSPVAWFAGFMPSANPRVALAVMLPGRSGGADAAPIARRILEGVRAGKV